MKVPLGTDTKSISQRKQPLVKSGKKWFEQKGNYEFQPNDLSEPSPKIVQFQEIASSLFDKDVELYQSQQGKRKKRVEMTWIKTAIKSGTLADKIAALTLVIQDSPVHNISSLENMICMVKTKKKRECLMALDTLKELFLSDLLIPGKKMANFSENPVDNLESLCSGNIEMIHRQLLLWHFEEKLKKCYQSFVFALEAMTYDSVETTKQKAVSAMYELLVSHPEQEQFLLSKLVNKLGDPLHRIAAKAARCLCLLIQKHPVMSGVVVSEVERLLYRPNIAVKAQYYGICFLNQIIFTDDDNELAAKLINIYFSFFKLCHKKGEVDSKMMSALLTGVNRAYPYVTNDIEAITNQMDALYKVVHTVNINISVQTLMLLFQVMNSKDSLTNRYYTALYRKLQDPNLKICSRQAMLLNLLYKSLKKDPSSARLKAFIKRLLQICSHLNPQIVCGILFLISELLKNVPNLLNLSQNQMAVDMGKLEDIAEKFKDDLENDENSATTSSWIHRLNAPVHSKNDSYDPKERNPLYAGASLECMWELKSLTRHYHPSVCLFANSLLEGKKIEYDGDPLQDFTLIRFLDRFVFRNPKKLAVSKTNESKSRSTFCKRLLRKLPSAKQIPVDSKDYISQTEQNVAADEKFMHKYLVQRAKDRERLGLDDSDNDSVTSDQFQNYLDGIEPGNKKNKTDIDFACEFGNSKNKKDDDMIMDEEELSDEDIELDEDELNKEFEEYDDLLEGNRDNEAQFKDKEMDFINAEDFNVAEMFEDVETAGTEALANKDNAHVKQLKWEMERDRRIKGRDWKQNKRKNFRRKNFGKKKIGRRK